MGSRGLVPLFLVTFLGFAGLAHAKDANCAGVLRGVYPLGGETRVEAVEAIAAGRAQELESYSGGLSVQEQLKGRRIYGLVAVRDEVVVGYLLYEKRDLFFEITNMAVRPGGDRAGIGAELIAALVKKAGETSGIEELRTIVRSESRDVQAFFSAVEFRVTEHLPRRFDRQSTSGTLMKRHLARDTEVPERQLAVAPKVQRVQVAVQTIPITREALLALDPTLQNAD